jgi:hypothetical protein
MLIVPIAGDKITIKDSDRKPLSVISYTNYKLKPAVYVHTGIRKPSVAIYFFDIETINDVRVDYIPSQKVFFAYGNIKRKIHLPQPNDLIVVDNSDIDENNLVKVEKLSLHNKAEGLGKGLLIKGDDDKYYRLSDILDIKRAIGDDFFDRKKFLKIYDDYRGYKG